MIDRDIAEMEYFLWLDRQPASCGTRPKGGDAHAAPALPSGAVPGRQTPNPSPIDPLNVEEGWRV